MPATSNRRLTRFLLRRLMRLHNATYSYISRLAVAAEGGLHPKHRLMNYHAFFTENVGQSDAVLDIGCGNGYLTRDVAARAGRVTAIDLSQENIETARRDFGGENITYVCGDATRLDYTERFDVVILSNVLEHLTGRVDFLRKMKALAPRILLRVPMSNRDWLTPYKAELGVENRLDLTHQTEYTLESLNDELAAAGLVIEKSSVQFGEIWAVVVAA